MGIGEMLGMRYQAWPDGIRTGERTVLAPKPIPDHVFDACVTLLTHALSPAKESDRD
jgi:hypothetical protein